MTADGADVASHARSRLRAGLADVMRLTEAYSQALVGSPERRAGHDAGRVSDLAVLRDQAGVLGRVASTATAGRVLDRVEESLLDRLGVAWAAARSGPG